jgi:hypothetical protein
MVVLQPKRRVDQFAIEDGRQGAHSQLAPGLRNEAIAFYQVASYAFRNGLYLDEEQIVPRDRAPAAAPPR